MHISNTVLGDQQSPQNPCTARRIQVLTSNRGDGNGEQEDRSKPAADLKRMGGSKLLILLEHVT